MGDCCVLLERRTQLVEFGDDGGAHLARFGVTPQRLFGKDQLSVDFDLEQATFGGNQRPGGDVEFEFALT